MTLLGTKFKNSTWDDPNIYTIIGVTEKRVIYTDGKTHSCGATNRKQSSSWLTVKGFLDRIERGEYEIIND